MFEPEQLPSKYCSGSDRSRGINRFGWVFVREWSTKFIDAPQSMSMLKDSEPRSGIWVLMRKDWEDWDEMGALEGLRRGLQEEKMVAAHASMGVSSVSWLRLPLEAPESLPHLTLCVGHPHPQQLLPQFHNLPVCLPLLLPKWRWLILSLVYQGMRRCSVLVFHISNKGFPDNIVLILHH